MPGTTRYSATFDRTYEEEPKPSSPPNARRSRSQSWQANSGRDGRQYTPFASRSPAPRSSSTDNNPSNGTEFIPTRTAKTSVKAHNNPFQFVKVGTCPLYKKAEEQLKKAKETKKPDVLKEEEEEWQTNLDSWKSRRRKMSEDVIRRQEEIKLFELEEQINQASQKKTKTFSEMVESRATRGRALSLCLLSSPLEFQNWEFEPKTHKNGSCSYTDESGENSTVNSEDEGVSVRGRNGEVSNETNHRTNGDAHIEQNGSKLDVENANCNKLSNTVQMKPKENSYVDSGLESISSSHRAGDTPDSGSDFSQDSNSSIDCDSPRTGVNVLEEFNSKSSQISEGHDVAINVKLDEKGKDFGFTFLGGKNEGQVIIASILEGSKAESSGMQLGDRILTIDGCDVNSKKHIELAALIQKGREKGQINLLLWRHAKTSGSTNGLSEKKHATENADENLNAKSYEKSIESENEMYVDDFEELKRQSELLANSKSDLASTNAQAETNGYKTPNRGALSLKFSSESSTAPILNTIASNCAVEEQDKNEEKAEINNGNQKKNVIKVKRVRRKGVYSLNVDPNHISREGNSTNSLFPLSPVTELPSPADETRTVSSTLSSNLSVSNSQDVNSNEKRQNDKEIMPKIPTPQENVTIAFTSSKTDSSKSADLRPADLKNVENKIQSNTENKTETKNASSITAKNEESQEEKSKALTGSKKTKSIKLKKGVTTENASASESTKKLSPSAQSAEGTSKAPVQELKSSESKSSHILENGLSTVENSIDSLTVLKTMESSSISSEPDSVTPATEVAIAPIKIQASVSSPCTDNKEQPLKVLTNGIDIPTANKQAKNLAFDENKPKKKKVIIKSKGNTTEKKSDGISADATLNEIYSTKEQNVSSVTEKQEKIGSKNETTVSPLKEEKNIVLNGVGNILKDVKSSSEKVETSIPGPSTNKVKDLALKFGIKNSSVNLESPVIIKNTKQSKTPLNEKQKLVIATKKENAKTKENSVQKSPPVTPQTVNETVIASSISPKVSIGKESKTEKAIPVVNPEKQPEITAKTQVVAASPKGAIIGKQVAVDNQQVGNKSAISSVSNALDTSNSKNLINGIQLKKEKKTTFASQNEQEKSAAKNETKVSPLARVITFYKSHK